MKHSVILASAYISAKERLLADGFAPAIDWQEALTLDAVTEQDFLREAAWVVLSAGLSATVVTRVFPKVAVAFLNFHSAQAIVTGAERCRGAAFDVFSHRGKIAGIISIADLVNQRTWPRLKASLAADGPSCLQGFPYIGPVTALHLAKNLGMDVVKPDRHLVRLASFLGFPDAAALCGVIASEVGDRVGVIDLVLWQYTAIHGIHAGHWSGIRAANPATQLASVQRGSGTANGSILGL